MSLPITAQIPTRLADICAEVEAFHDYLRARSQRAAQVPSAGRDLIQRLGERLALFSGATLPVKPEIAAHLLGVSVAMVRESATGQLGKLEPVTGGFRAVLYGQAKSKNDREELLPAHASSSRPTLTPQGRFTLAHELGHALFYSSPQPNEIPRRVIPASTGTNDRWREEGLCHEFARALLLPSIARSVLDHTPSPQAIVAGTHAFGVSREVLVRRALYDWSMWRGATLVHVVLVGEQPSIKTFLGKDVPPTSSIMRRLRKKGRDLSAISPVNLASVVERHLGCKRESLLVGNREIWAVFT